MDSTVETKESQDTNFMLRFDSGDPINIPVKKDPNDMMALRESERTGKKIEPTINVEFKKPPEINTILLLDVNGDKHIFKVTKPIEGETRREFRRSKAVFVRRLTGEELDDLKTQNEKPEDMVDYLTNDSLSRLGLDSGNNSSK